MPFIKISRSAMRSVRAPRSFLVPHGAHFAIVVESYDFSLVVVGNSLFDFSFNDDASVFFTQTHINTFLSNDTLL